MPFNSYLTHQQFQDNLKMTKTKCAVGEGLSRRLTIFVVSLCCAACGTFQLSGGIPLPASKTVDQQQTDTLVCKDQAMLEANTAERQVGAFLLGMTIVGTPLAYELEKSKQREVFARCMTARGYTVPPPDDGPKQAVVQQRPSNQISKSVDDTSKKSVEIVETKAIPPTGAAASARDDVTQLERLKSLRDRGVITEEDYIKKKKDILDRM